MENVGQVLEALLKTVGDAMVLYGSECAVEDLQRGSG
jgi:hypothetical protein